MAPFVEFDLAVIIHSTTESVRLYGTPVSIGGKTPNMLTVRSGRQTVSCRGLAVPGARNTQLRLLHMQIKPTQGFAAATTNSYDMERKGMLL